MQSMAGVKDTANAGCLKDNATGGLLTTEASQSPEADKLNGRILLDSKSSAEAAESSSVEAEGPGDLHTMIDNGDDYNEEENVPTTDGWGETEDGRENDNGEASSSGDHNVTTDTSNREYDTRSNQDANDMRSASVTPPSAASPQQNIINDQQQTEEVVTTIVPNSDSNETGPKRKATRGRKRRGRPPNRTRKVTKHAEGSAQSIIDSNQPQATTLVMPLTKKFTSALPGVESKRNNTQIKEYRWRAHRAAEDYISLVGDIMYPGTYFGAFGYNSDKGNYPVERPNTLGLLTSPLRRPTVIEKWSPYEVASFEAALTLYGKVFHSVQKVVKTKSTKEIVEFYYVWKKTSHYKRWKQQHEPEIDADEMEELDWRRPTTKKTK